MLTLTDDARLAIRGLSDPASATEDAGIRIATTEIPVDGQGPELALRVADHPAPGDLVVDDGGARVFLDETAAVLLADQTLDVEIDERAE